MTNEEIKDKENQFIDGLFDNEYSKEKLAEFIADNLKVHHRYDLYPGEYVICRFQYADTILK